MEFQNKVVLITGGANGIGRETSFAFCEEGAKVAIVDTDKINGKRTVDEITMNGGKAVYICGDVSSEKDVFAIKNKVINIYGGLDVLINNAAIGHDGTVIEDSPATWDYVVSTNLRSVFLCCHFLIPELKKRDSGVIVNVGSIQSLVAKKRSAAYITCKFGLLGLTKAIAVDHAPRIRANAILPGSTATELFKKGAIGVSYKDFVRSVSEHYPMQRIASPREVANVILFLSSNKASFINGTGIVVDGGLLAKSS